MYKNKYKNINTMIYIKLLIYKYHKRSILDKMYDYETFIKNCYDGIKSTSKIENDIASDILNSGTNNGKIKCLYENFNYFDEKGYHLYFHTNSEKENFLNNIKRAYNCNISTINKSGNIILIS